MIEKRINEISELNDIERLQLGKYSAKVYYNFCMNLTDSIDNCNTLFVASICTIVGIDLSVDKEEYNYFRSLLKDTNIDFDTFYDLVKGWTNKKTIIDTDNLFDNLMDDDTKKAFLNLIICLAYSNGELNKNELNLINKYYR